MNLKAHENIRDILKAQIKRIQLKGKKVQAKKKHCDDFQLSTRSIGQEMDKSRDTFLKKSTNREYI